MATTFGQNVERARKAKNLKRREVSERMGVAPGSTVVADLEADRHALSLEKAMRAAKAVGVPLDTLLRGVDADYDLVCQQGRDTRQSSPGSEKVGGDVASPSATRLLARIEELENTTRQLSRVLAAIAEQSVAAQQRLAIENRLATKPTPGRRSNR